MTQLLNAPWFWPLLGYVVGGVPVGLVLARARGIDLRRVGSGNIGATNAVRAMGARWGLVVFALDVLKAYLPVMAAGVFLQGPNAALLLHLTGLMTVAGHIFPVTLKFRGGKGVACAFGVFTALQPLLAVAGAVLYAQGLALTRSSAAGSLTAVSAMALTVWVTPHDAPIRGLALALALLIWVRHRGNIRDLVAQGRERKKAAKTREGEVISSA